MGEKHNTHKFSQDEIIEILNYFSSHTAASTCRQFKISGSKLNTLLKKQGIMPHNAAVSETLKHIEQDCYDKYSEVEINNFILEYNNIGNIEDACEKLNIKEYFLKFLLMQRNIEVKSKSIARTDWTEVLNEKTEQEIIDFYLTPHTLSDTFKQYSNISRIQIEKILDKNNIERHSAEIINKLSREAAIKTTLERYGVENPFAAKEIKAKLQETKLQKYGNRTFTNREKAKETCIQKYNSDTFLGSKTAKEQNVFIKSHENRQANWLDNLKNTEENIDFYNCRTNRDFAINFISNLPDNTIGHLADALKITYSSAMYLVQLQNLRDYINFQGTNRSHYEDEIIEFIGREICQTNVRNVIPGYEIDIYIPDKKLGIEFNGTYWHSTATGTPKNYHLEKSKLAQEIGIRLIHIYEYEWVDLIQQEKIKLLLNIALGRAQNRIYARQCNIRQLSNKEAKVLNDQIHLQNHRSAQVTYGLFYQNKLVQLMSFSKTKYNRNLSTENSWEIIRGCPGSNNIVVGGVSKLFKHFVRDYNPDFVFSYCDFNKFDGKSYEALGMKFIGYTGPDMKWLLSDGTVVNRNPKKHNEYTKNAKSQIFGAGSKKYLWSKENI